MAKMTLIGMYNYDQTLFNGLTFPTGIDKDIAVNEILIRANEFCVLYTDPDFMKIQIGIWGQKHYRTFEKWITALNIQYDPLHNYDRHEEWKDGRGLKTSSKTEADYNNDRTANLTDKNTISTSDNRIPNLTEKVTNDTTDTTAQMFPGNDETQVSAYDSSSYQPKEKITHDAGTMELLRTGDVTTETTGQDTISHSGTNTVTHTGTDKTNTKGTIADTTGSETENSSHEGHLYGNIGVTTSQQMLRDELDIDRWNIYENIADIFVDEFCIQIY